MPARTGRATHRGSVSLVEAVTHAERAAVTDALRAAGGNRTRAAALLGVSRVTLYNKLRSLPPAIS
jgi:DNA-binding NtrC family response regulator